jgi:hypothetical protein
MDGSISYSNASITVSQMLVDQKLIMHDSVGDRKFACAKTYMPHPVTNYFMAGRHEVLTNVTTYGTGTADSIDK